MYDVVCICIFVKLVLVVWHIGILSYISVKVYLKELH